MPNTISIFLASSSELSRERQYIGNRVRIMNEEWEQRGIRIILNIWEDYAPEFTGERKQTDYDLNLVDKSDIVFGMFRKICGKYSQEEVLRGYKNNPATLHCYKLPSNDDSAVRAFERTIGIAMEEAVDIEDIWQRIQKTTEEYITAHHPAPTAFPTQKKERIYATLGEDLRMEEDALGNMIRGLDDLAERQIGIRCSMLPLMNNKRIGESDYYLALLNDVLDAHSRDEFLAAYHGLTRKKHPSAMAPFQKKGGKVTDYDTDNEITSLMYQPGKEFFPIEYESLDTIKMTLLVHLLRKSKVLSPDNVFAIGENGSLYFGGRRLVDTSKALGLSTEQVSEFVVQVELLELMMPGLPKLGMEARLRDEIRELLSADDLSETDAKALVEKCTSLITFLKRNVGRFYQSDYVLRMMLLRIACNDRYSEQIGLTPDVYYKEFIDYADRYSIADVIVEEMRINLANAFARSGQEDEAMRLFGVARRNIKRFDLANKVLRPKLFLLYYNALAVLSTIRQEEELNQWAAELEDLIKQWIAEDASLVYYKCYPTAFRIDVLSVDMLANERQLSAAEGMWKEMMALSSHYSDDRFSYLQAVHGLTKALSRYYVDRISVDGLSMDVRMSYARKAHSYLDDEEVLCRELMTYDREEALKHYAALLHNRGFLQTKMGRAKEAFASYLHCLDIRKRLFTNMPTVSREDDVAETMVNIGALLLETPGRFVSNSPEIRTDALYYAEIALEIYARHNDGTLYHATNEFKARLLKGTVLYHKGVDEDQKQEGLAILREVKQWDEENPENYYHGTIMNELGKIVTDAKDLF